MKNSKVYWNTSIKMSYETWYSVPGYWEIKFKKWCLNLNEVNKMVPNLVCPLLFKREYFCTSKNIGKSTWKYWEKIPLWGLRLQKKTAVSALPSAFYGEEIHFCCLSHETCGTLKQQLWQIQEPKKQKSYPLNTARAAWHSLCISNKIIY